MYRIFSFFVDGCVIVKLVNINTDVINYQVAFSDLSRVIIVRSYEAWEVTSIVFQNTIVIGNVALFAPSTINSWKKRRKKFYTSGIKFSRIVSFFSPLNTKVEYLFEQQWRTLLNGGGYKLKHHLFSSEIQ